MNNLLNEFKSCDNFDIFSFSRKIIEFSNITDNKQKLNLFLSLNFDINKCLCFIIGTKFKIINEILYNIDQQREQVLVEISNHDDLSIVNMEYQMYLCWFEGILQNPKYNVVTNNYFKNLNDFIFNINILEDFEIIEEFIFESEDYLNRLKEFVNLVYDN